MSTARENFAQLVNDIIGRFAQTVEETDDLGAANRAYVDIDGFRLGQKLRVAHRIVESSAQEGETRGDDAGRRAYLDGALRMDEALDSPVPVPG